MNTFQTSSEPLLESIESKKKGGFACRNRVIIGGIFGGVLLVLLLSFMYFGDSFRFSSFLSNTEFVGEPGTKIRTLNGIFSKRIELQSWKRDYLHRPKNPKGVTTRTLNTGISNIWTMEFLGHNRIRLKSWKGDYLVRIPRGRGVTSCPSKADPGSIWKIYPNRDGTFRLLSNKGDYLHRPNTKHGVTTWGTGIGNNWKVFYSRDACTKPNQISIDEQNQQINKEQLPQNDRYPINEKQAPWDQNDRYPINEEQTKDDRYPINKKQAPWDQNNRYPINKKQAPWDQNDRFPINEKQAPWHQNDRYPINEEQANDDNEDEETQNAG